MRILKSFEQKINEIAYLDKNNIVLITEDYNSSECSMKEKKFNILNVSNAYVIEKTIKDCLNTQVVNELINVK